MQKKYNTGLAFLRLWMCFEVVCDHFYDWSAVQSDDLRFPLKLLSTYGGIAVPIFMLMSFTLWDVEKKASDGNTKVLNRRLWRLATPHIVWTIIYFVGYKGIEFFGDTKLIEGGWRCSYGSYFLDIA